MIAQDPRMRPVETTVTFLKMDAPAGHRIHPPRTAGRLMLVAAPKPPVSFYRYLYEAVGKPWIWVNRRRSADGDLATLIHDDRVEIYVLHVDGAPAGYAEIDRRQTTHAELAYFGLTPDFIGRGLGAWFLNEAIGLAWGKQPPQLTVQTCTLDHPRALRNYQRCGFIPVRQSRAEVLPIGDEPHPLVEAMRV
jgi:GNAT superfamily N-acetyltransferase